MALIKFHDWLAQQQESSASTRARREVALGLRTPTGMGNVNSHSTAAPWEQEAVEKQIKKQKKKKRPKKKGLNKSGDANKIDSWLKEVDALEDSLEKLKSVYEKNKRKLKSPEKPKVSTKPMDNKPDQASEKDTEMEKDDRDSRERTPGSKEQAEDTED